MRQSTDRWTGPLGSLRTRLASKMELPSLRMIREWRNADLVIVTTRVSFVLAIVARALGKPLIFLDAMCGELPRKQWRRLGLRYALQLSHGCIGLSKSQAAHWAEQLRVGQHLFTAVPFGIDPLFYSPDRAAPGVAVEQPYILSVGRDPARDFSTLTQASKALGWRLALVTKPYLIPPNIASDGQVRVLDNLSYPELFALYQQAQVAVVPVIKGTTFMSGIRATMEAMLMNTPVVLARTAGMMDYFKHEEHVLFFEPENAESLVGAIRRLDGDPELRARLTSQARELVLQQHSAEVFIDSIERVFSSVLSTPQSGSQ